MTNHERIEIAREGIRYFSHRFRGPFADEIWLRCRPEFPSLAGISGQAKAIYKGISALLREKNGTLENVVQETVHFRNIKRDFEAFQKMRLQVMESSAGANARLPASTFVEQPPLDSRADIIVTAFVVLPHERDWEGRSHLAPASGRSYLLGGNRHLCAGSLYGAPGSAFDQTFSMFELAEDLLQKEGMSFRDVVRTWIYLRHMERDYSEFNRGRREFFRQRHVSLLPASTGIYGSPYPEKADFVLSFLAIQAPQPLAASAMTTPTLNEACSYGSDFSRGLRVDEENKTALYVSGTASVDEEGRTAHAGDFAKQTERMLWNVEMLLAAHEASFQDVVTATTYLKDPDDAPLLLGILRKRGLADFPHTLVHAAVCRPDLLCEMEALAAMPPATGQRR
jgi:2-iminobutanoate/2-iminopropanoate deaminase